MTAQREKVLARLRRKAAQLPDEPGVYLFKDARYRVLYVGKALSLRSRVGSYFQPSADLPASRGPEIARMVADLVVDIDLVPCDSEVDALLRENRLIKDIQPRFNERLRDDKTFPYLQVRTGEDFPRVEITREPLGKGVKLFGPFVYAADLRAALPLLQRAFKFRTCKLEIAEGDPRRLAFRPCILHAIKQCAAPCAARISRADYRRSVADLIKFLSSRGSALVKRLKREMAEASAALEFEKAAAMRDELKAIAGLQHRGLIHEHVQPEAFFVDPAEGLARLAEILGAKTQPRIIEGIDIAHLGGGETAGSLVCFIDGKPFKGGPSTSSGPPSGKASDALSLSKGGYRRFRIRTAEAGDDYAAIREVVFRRYQRAGLDEELFPDLILIDGGKGQLQAALSAFDDLPSTPPAMVSLAKREETLYVHGRQEGIRLSRNDPALRLVMSIRDEAHRFAQAYHHILRRRKTLERTAPVRHYKRKPKTS